MIADIVDGFKPQVLLEARHADGRLVDGQVQQKRTYNLRENVIKQKPCSGLRQLLLTMSQVTPIVNSEDVNDIHQ